MLKGMFFGLVYAFEFSDETDVLEDDGLVFRELRVIWGKVA